MIETLTAIARFLSPHTLAGEGHAEIGIGVGDRSTLKMSDAYGWQLVFMRRDHAVGNIL